MINFKRPNTILGLVIFFLVGGYLVLTSFKTNQTMEPIKIGALVALTSYGAPDGSEELRGYELAFEEANKNGGIQGRTVQLIVEDTASDTQTAITAYNKLVHSDETVAVLGPTYSEFIEAILPTMNAERVPTLTSCADASKKQFQTFGQYSFITAIPEDDLIEYIGKTMKEWRIKSVALFTNINYYSESIHELMKESAERNGIKVVLEKRFSLDVHDFKTILLQAKKSGAQSIFFPSADLLERGNVVKQMIELNMPIPLFTDDTAHSNDLLEEYGDVLENRIFFPVWKTEQKTAERFEKEYTGKYGRLPNSLCAIRGYDSANILLSVLSKGAWSREQIVNKLNAIQNIETVSFGTISLDSEGIASSNNPSFSLFTVQSRKFVEYTRKPKP